MYSNRVYKYGWVPMQFGDTKIIDNNAIVQKKLEELQAEMEAEFKNTQGGFKEGLTPEEIAAMVDAGFDDGIDENGLAEPVKTADEIMEETQAQIDEMMQQAMAEIEDMKAKAQVEINQAMEETKKTAFDKGYEEGYQEGQSQGYQEGKKEGLIEGTEEGKHSFDEQKKALQTEYEEKKEVLTNEYYQKVEELEPRFISTLTSIYEHIFEVDLSKNKDIIVHLIGNTMRNIEGDSGYLIHVSKEDYPYVSVQKKEMLQGCGMNPEQVEVIEDATLSRNECMIETASGVFDCSLGTELAALREQLQLLAFSTMQTEK